MTVPRIGIVVALPAEARSLVDVRPAFDRIIAIQGGHHLTVAGTGSEWARQGAERLLASGAEALLSWGCAGGLSPTLKPGALVVPEIVLGADGTALATSETWRSPWRDRLARWQTPVTSAGILAESLRITASSEAKRSLAAATGAVAVDMESATLARFAARHDLPFLAIRAIADPVEMDLPRAIGIALDARGDVDLSRLLGHACRHPGQFLELARLGRAFAAAMRSLRRVRREAGEDFLYPV